MNRMRRPVVACVAVAVAAASAVIGPASPVAAAPAGSGVATSVAVLDTSPATIVQSYFNAINAGDYQTAWQLGGNNLSPSYAAFVQGFATTDFDTVTILDTNGDVVTVSLQAQHIDGSTAYYQGTYTVHNGVITRARLVRR
jgi:hypothetical protein